MTQENETKPPSHFANDWNFFVEHVDKEFEISSYFDKENWKTKTNYRMRVSHIFDPSHFWVVIKEVELNDFVKYMHSFYSMYGKLYKIPEMKYLKRNMYCVCFTDGAYYRSIIVNIPLAIDTEVYALAVLIDFGFMAKVSLDNIYILTKQMYSVPQFAVRATLSGLGPISSTKWSSEIVTKFSSLVLNKILLCEVTKKNNVKKILYLKLVDYNWEKEYIEHISDIMMIDRMAKQMTLADLKEVKNTGKNKSTKRGQKIKFQFLSPSFTEIEKGLCMDTVKAAEYRNI